MSLARGDHLGPYRIESPLGAGGMGEVYRARDTRLERDVAVKVLPSRLADSPEALSRFEREAKAVAALSHPGILAIHDFGRDGAVSYAVMELLEGETLRYRLAGGALPLRKAVDYAQQVAHALAAAHARGVVHRDLKPENLFVTGDGRVKVLDFGLARHDDAADGDARESETLARQTDPGTVLGTVGYMSPEQVRGQLADARSDIFAFGTVLHEMLTGRRAFQRDTAAETMTAILKEEPAALRSESEASASGLPLGLARLLSRCLEKNPEERFQSARDLAFALEAAGTASSAQGAAPAPATNPGAAGLAAWRRARPLAWLAMGAVLGVLLTRALVAPPSVEPPRTRPLTFSGQDRDPAASPDGRLIAFSSTRDGSSRIWIKQLQGGGEAPLTSGDDRFPRFAPDGASVLFVRQDERTRSVYRIALVGGEPRKLADDVALADWFPDGARMAFLRVRTLPAGPDGGTRRQWLLGVRDLASGTERTLYEPRDVPLDLRIAPDGRAIALIEGPSVLNTRFSLSLVDSDSGAVRNLLAPGHPLGCLAWAASGQLVLARAGSPLGDGSGSPGRVFLLDARRQAERGLLYTSGLFPLAGGIESRTGSCDVLGPGQLVLDQNEWRMNLHELPLGESRSGPRPLTSGDSRDRQPAYSPDGSRIVFSSNRSGNMDLWLLERATGALRQLTDDPAQDWDPGFTPDGRHLLWSSDRSGNLEIWIAEADGSNARQLTRDGVDAENPTATPDGRYVCYTTAHPERLGLWRVRLDGSDDRQLVKGDALVPEVSPDGRHVVYLGDVRASTRVLKVAEVESGAVVPFEIEVAWPARASGQVLFGRARWLPDGQRIAFVGADAAGRSGIWIQDFVPGRDTTASRRPIAGFADHAETESLGVSADGKSLVVSELLEYSSLRLVDGLFGVVGTSRQAGR